VIMCFMMECNIYKTVKKIHVSKKKIESVVFCVLDHCNLSGGVSVHFIGDKRMRTMNRLYRGKDSTTDVLSFSAQEGEAFPKVADDWGDIFISVPKILVQAREYGVSYNSEVVRMLIHGVLHLLGYDHVKKNDAKEMFAIQDYLHKKCL